MILFGGVVIRKKAMETAKTPEHAKSQGVTGGWKLTEKVTTATSQESFQPSFSRALRISRSYNCRFMVHDLLRSSGGKAAFLRRSTKGETAIGK